MKRSKPTIALVALFFLSACATYDLQFTATPQPEYKPASELIHTVYLIGDAGNSPLGTKSKALASLGEALKTADENSTVLFLGDNVYPDGVPKKDEEGRAFAEHQLNVQTEVVKDYPGEAIFIPGNHDWYSDGPKGLKRQERYVEDILGKNSFLPENGCPIRKVEVNETTEIIIVDTEWYLAKWDKYPTINDDCEFRTRSRFFDEFESLIKKARGKTTIVAMHHPMFTNGPHGGQYSFGQHMSPLPVLGTLKNIIRRTGGVSPQDLQNKRYDELKDRIVTLAQENKKTIFVSGHEHSLQYIVENNIPQIISGAGSKINPTRNVGKGKFSYGSQGWAKLSIYMDGASRIEFFGAEEDAVVYQSEVFPPDQIEVPRFNDPIPPTFTASVYSKEETERGSGYKWFWGERYRDVFSKEVTVPTVKLDTMFGGLTPVRRGGGHQSNSLRFENAEGQEYVMRAIRKNAVQYIQSVAFKEQFVRDEFTDTDTEELVMDFFTASHPFAFLAIGELSDAVGIYHTDPKLYYVPKQNAIGQYNDEYGDELYMIERRAADGHGDHYSFGFSDNLISTNDMIDKLRKDEDHVVDQRMYVRARLFDMLLGDWDRHYDQWRWAVFKEDGKTIYRPVPRDRDQAFALMDDGFATGLATTLVPPIRLIRSYEEELKSPKWMNLEPFPLDMAFLTQLDQKAWWDEAQYIQSKITDEVIESAFTNLPEEVQDKYVDNIKKTLKGRRGHLTTIAEEYFHIINKYGVITGTDKDDWFEIERMPNGQTKVSAYRIKGGEKADLLHERTYKREETREIWLYGLDDKDYFLVKGKGSNLIKLRIIGGLNNDQYDIQNGNKVHVYDFRSKNNTLLTGKGRNHIRDDYDTNNYDYKRPKYNSNVLIPTLGGNPDDGLKVGLLDTWTVNGFERNPFTAKHVFSANYFSATQGFDFGYEGEFANAIGDWNLVLNGKFTSPNFAINFFGFGNSTPNPEAEDEDNFDLDYNRVKLGTISGGIGLISRGEVNGEFRMGVDYESIELDETEGRFINLFTSMIPQEIENNFVRAEASYLYEQYDEPAFPTLGLQFLIRTGIVSNVDNDNSFTYLVPSLAFNYKLGPSGQLVFATKSKAHINFGDDFEFYQAASIGGNDGLRGYRNQRFTGKSSFYQTSDLRLNFNRYKTSIVPVELGIFAGFDIGRVWVDDDLVLNPGENMDDWNTSVGGGFFINGADFMTANFGAFDSDDGIRIYFGFGFGF